MVAGLLFCLALATTGCGTRRTITITSDPAGAMVYLNDREVGRTPVTVEFLWYGVYDVRLEAEGYEALWTTGQADAPLWDMPGPDLVAEAVGYQVDLRWHFELAPREQAATEDVVDRARQMRASVRQGE